MFSVSYHACVKSENLQIINITMKKIPRQLSLMMEQFHYVYSFEFSTEDIREVSSFLLEQKEVYNPVARKKTSNGWRIQNETSFADIMNNAEPSTIKGVLLFGIMTCQPAYRRDNRAFAPITFLLLFCKRFWNA